MMKLNSCPFFYPHSVDNSNRESLFTIFSATKKDIIFDNSKYFSTFLCIYKHHFGLFLCFIILSICAPFVSIETIGTAFATLFLRELL